MDPVFRVWSVKLLNLVLRVLNLLGDCTLGWTTDKGTRKERETARRRFGQSAQVIKVVCKANYMPGYPTPLNSAFVFMHEEYINPNLVLEGNFALSHIDEKEVYFAAGEPGRDFYDTAKYPFLCVGLYTADRYIRMPLSSFHMMTEEIADPKSIKIGVTAMTARCGSTLLSQIMNRAPKTKSISEPPALACLWHLYFHGSIDRMQMEMLMRSALKFMLRPTPEIERIFVKLDRDGNPQLGMIRKCLPIRAVMIASTRHPKPSLKSFRKIVKSFTLQLYGKTGLCWQTMAAPAPIPEVDNEKYDRARAKINPMFKNMSWDENVSLFYAGSLACMKEHRKVFNLAILYEDIVENPEKVVKRLFEAMDVSGEHLSEGLRALERDSQMGIFDKEVNVDISENLRRSLEEMYRELDLPISVDCSMDQFRKFVDDNICRTLL